MAVVPGIDTFIDRVPAVLFDVSNDQLPALLFVHDHDVGLELPLSKDPLAITLGAVAGNSRYINPDPIPPAAYSTPFNCKLVTDPADPNPSLNPSPVDTLPCPNSAGGAASHAETPRKKERAIAGSRRRAADGTTESLPTTPRIVALETTRPPS